MEPQNGQPASKSPPPSRPEPGTREFTFPLIDGAAVLRVPHPMGAENFNVLLAMLNAAKTALTGPPKSDGQ